MTHEVINRDYIKRMLVIHRQEVRRLENVNLGCNGCDQFKLQERSCSMHATTVPQEHIATGCDSWRYDEIPF